MILLSVTSLLTPFVALADTAPDLVADLPTATRQRLKDATTLAALAEVYNGKVRQAPTFPFLVITPLFTEPPSLNPLGTYYEPDFYQISVFSRDELEADQLADAARAELSPRSTNSKLTFENGKIIWQEPGERRRSRWVGTEGAGQGDVWKSSFDAVFWVQRWQ